MSFRGDERGQPVLIGFILLFGMLVVAFASYQAVVVPSQNAEVEYQHSQQIETEFSELRSNVVNAVESGDQRSTSITMGTDYPARLIAMNPSPMSGRLETTERAEVELDPDGIDGVADVCGEAAGGETHSQSLVYAPDYSEYGDAGPVTYENNFVSREFQNGAVHGDQRFVRSSGGITRIDLLLLTGEASTTQGTPYGIDVRASNRYAETVRPEEDFTLVLPSRFDAGTWDDEILDDTSVVEVDQADEDRVAITFEGDGERTYRLSCAVAGLNGEPAFQPPTQDGGAEVGQGGVTAWDHLTTTQRISQPGGVWRDVGSADSIVLSEPRLSPINPDDGEVYEDERWFRIGFTIGGPDDDDTRYTITVPDDGAGLHYDVGSSTWPPNLDPTIGFIKEDGDGTSELSGSDEGTLTGEALDDWLSGEDLDLLDPDNYENNDIQDSLDEIREYLSENGGHEVFITDATGRVDLTVEDSEFEPEPTPTPSPPSTPEPGDGDFSVEITEFDEQNRIGEDVTVTTEIENTGEESDEQTIELYVVDEDEVVDTQELQLDSTTGDTVELTWETHFELAAGEYEVVVQSQNDQDSREVTLYPTFLEISAEATDAEHQNHGLRDVEITWELNEESVDIELNVYDEEDGSLEDSEAINEASQVGNHEFTNIDQDDGAWIEAEIDDSGDVWAGWVENEENYQVDLEIQE